MWKFIHVSLCSAAVPIVFISTRKLNFSASVFSICSPIHVYYIPFLLFMANLSSPYQIGFIWDQITFKFFTLDIAVLPLLSLYLANVCPFVHRRMWRFSTWTRWLLLEVSGRGLWPYKDDILPCLTPISCCLKYQMPSGRIVVRRCTMVLPWPQLDFNRNACFCFQKIL